LSNVGETRIVDVWARVDGLTVCPGSDRTRRRKMHDHRDLSECGAKCILELQDAVTAAEIRANNLAAELDELRAELSHVKAAHDANVKMHGEAQAYYRETERLRGELTRAWDEVARLKDGGKS
jgi:hypothetical protein